MERCSTELESALNGKEALWLRLRTPGREREGPSEEAIEAAAKQVAINDGWSKFHPLTKHVAFAKAALIAAYAIDFPPDARAQEKP